MKLSDWLGKKVRVEFIDGQIMSGLIDDYTSSPDNDDQGEYLGIKPDSGKFANQAITFYEHEIKKIEVIN